MSFPVTQLVVDATRAGGEALLALRDRPREVQSKGFRDEVTDADYAAQEAIFAAIRAHYPEAVIASEENDFGQGITDWEPPQGPGGWPIRWTARPITAVGCPTSA